LIIIDTGPFVALFDRDDRYHSLCGEIFQRIEGPLITSWPVITECFYLLNFSWEAQDSLWVFIQRGGVEIYPLERELQVRCRELMRQYQDLPMDLADATLVAVGEVTGVSRIFTLDHKDFAVYRLRKRKRFTLIPPHIS